MRACAAISAGPDSSWRPAVLINSRPAPKLNKGRHSQIAASQVIDQLMVTPHFYCQMTTCCIGVSAISQWAEDVPYEEYTCMCKK